MGRDKTKKSTVREIVAEIAHDLGIDKKLVRQVLILTFKEIALTLILRGRPVMIRRFVKFVVAISAARKIKQEKDKEKNKEE
jgi:nucleoid DNA-binding protein